MILANPSLDYTKRKSTREIDRKLQNSVVDIGKLIVGFTENIILRERSLDTNLLATLPTIDTIITDTL
jgi:hypothetical protein